MRIGGFEFAEGARFQRGAITIDANAVGRHLEYLKDRCHGELTPQDVLDDAKSHNSPLHTFFEWDDTAAAEQYRLHQARGLIRSVVAVYVDDVRPAQRMKAFVHVPEPGAPHYRDTSHALSQEKTRDLVLKRAWRELVQWKNKYKDLSEFADIVAAADAVSARLPRSIRQG